MGSQVTIITSRDLKLDTLKPSKYMVDADGTQLNVIGESEVELSNKNESVNCFGFMLVIHWSVVVFFVFDPFTEFADIFSITLKADTKPCQIFSTRPIPIGQRDQA